MKAESLHFSHILTVWFQIHCVRTSNYLKKKRSLNVKKKSWLVDNTIHWMLYVFSVRADM